MDSYVVIVIVQNKIIGDRGNEDLPQAAGESEIEMREALQAGMNIVFVS